MLHDCIADIGWASQGEKKEIAGKDLFDSFHLDYIPELSAEYETYPNRNSLQYIDVYGISTTQTMIRGTYRNKGTLSLSFIALTLECPWHKCHGRS
jgi:hypothetical protein